MSVNNEFSAAFNRIREAYQNKSLDRDEILKILIGGIPDFPKSGYIVSIFVRKGVLIKVGSARYTKYRFPNTPVYIGALSACISEMKEYFKKQNKPLISNKKSEITEEYCIKFLKERGYRIMREITTFEEV